MCYSNADGNLRIVLIPSPSVRPTPSPLAAAIIGAAGIALSGVWVVLADVPPATGAFFRCAYAVPLLVVVARRRRPAEPTSPRTRAMGLLAGAFFTVDLVLWHSSIHLIGAGLSTVLAAGQVVLVPLLSWLLLRERPAPRVLVAIPGLLTGVVMISGVLNSGPAGPNAAKGALYAVLASAAYAGFLLALRAANPGGTRSAAALRDATAIGAVGAALATVAGGHAATLVPEWPSMGWLLVLAVGSQVVSWLLITGSLPRLPAAVSSVVLVLQPVGSVVLATVLLGERPTLPQLAGVTLVMVAVMHATGALRAVGSRWSGRREVDVPVPAPQPG